MYGFFKSQGKVVINEVADFIGINGYCLYPCWDIQEGKNTLWLLQRVDGIDKDDEHYVPGRAQGGKYMAVRKSVIYPLWDAPHQGIRAVYLR